jgi:hypothetical protein
MGGIDRSRLAASKARQHFVKEAKRAVYTMGREVSRDLLSPTLVGALPLFFPISPIFKADFGYQGDLLFLQFSYAVASPQFGYSDGGDDLPSDQRLRSRLLNHPVISSYLPENRYPTLYGKFPSGPGRPALEEIMGRGVDLPTCRCLLLDRRDRRAYISQQDKTMMLFALAEPAEGDDHNVFVDGLLMSPGSENYKFPSAPELLTEFCRFLDSQVLGEQCADCCWVDADTGQVNYGF